MGGGVEMPQVSKVLSTSLGLLEDMYGDINAAYEQSHLVHLLRQHRPNILVDENQYSNATVVPKCIL